MSLSASGQATLLLTLRLPGTKGADSHTPLSQSEWRELAGALHAQGRRPEELLRSGSEELIAGLASPRMTVERLRALLGRGTALALALERWERAGLWILTRADQDYPSRLRQRLRGKAPPFLLGAGTRKLLEQGGRAIVGARDASADQLDLAATLGARAAADGVQVVSGGARGVDEAALQASLEAGGNAVAVLADSLLRAATSSRYRSALMEGRLALLSPSPPESRFSVGAAMGRNKLIHALADESVVVSVRRGQGGTWAGAVENLKAGWVPLLLAPGAGDEAALSELLSLGARRLEDSVPHRAAAASATEAGPPGVRSEFDRFLTRFREATGAGAMEPGELADALGLEPKQVAAWLKRAVSEGLASKRGRPSRYAWSAAGSGGRQQDLFDE